MTAVRNIQLYPPESAAITQALEQIKQPIDNILEQNECLMLSHSEQVLLVNGQRLEAFELAALTETILELLGRLELKGIAFRRGVTQDELKALVVALGRTKPESVEPGFWREFSGRARSRTRGTPSGTVHSRVRKSRTMVSVVSAAEDEELSASELRQIPDMLRALHGAATNVKLYSVDAQPVVQAMTALCTELDTCLSRHPALTLAHLGESLLINGAKVDTAGYQAVAEGFVAFSKSVSLDSLTFFAPVSLSEIETFIGALRDLPASGTERSHWDEFAMQHALRSIAFNQRQYTLGVVQSLLDDVGAPPVDEMIEVDATAVLIETLPDDPTEAIRESPPRFGKDMLVKGENKLLRRLLATLFGDFSTLDPIGKEQVVQSCARLLSGLILGLQHKFSALAVDYLSAALSEETDPRIVQELAGVLYTMAGCAVQFADYPLAGRIH